MAKTTISLPSLGLTDADGDRILMWEDSAGAIAQLAASTNLTISGTNITGDTQGVSEIDGWWLTSDQDCTADNTMTFVTANWARATYRGNNYLGTGLTESSGVFSFPSTGFWIVKFHCLAENDNTDTTNFGMFLHSTEDNSTYSLASCASASDSGDHATLHSHAGSFIFDVTNTTNDKFKFAYYSDGANNNFKGNSSENKTGFVCYKLAET